MSQRVRALAIVGAALLASCGRPDASGAYLSKSDRQAALIQLIQNKDGVITGRLEVMTVGPGGVLSDESANLDGAASKHDLVLKPTSVWFGGASASGSFTGDALTISRSGSELKAQKVSLGAFQKAVSQLKTKAAEERRQAAEALAKQAVQTAQAATFEDAADKGAKLQKATAELRADTAKLNEGVSAAPDFGQQSSDNTARIAKMAQSAPGLSRMDRGRLAVSANQLIIGTNQIDVARTQYAVGLDQIVQRAAPVATAVQRFCDTPQAGPFEQPCAQAKAAATDFESALVHGATVFKGYKQTVQTELSHQTEMVQRLGG